MTSGNINLRDPVMYRILHAPATTAPATPGASTRCTTGRTASRTRSSGSRTRSAPSSSRTTGRSTTGSSRRWASTPPRQIEFARLNVTHTVLSKRKLLRLVQESSRRRLGRSAHADARRHPPPRHPAGGAARLLRADRRHQTGVGGRVSRCSSTACARSSTRRRRAPHGGARPGASSRSSTTRKARSSELEAVNNPEDPAAGTRLVPFSRELWIDRDDFLEDPPKKFFRLAPGREVRLRWALHRALRRGGEGRGRRRSSSSAARTTRPRAAARRRTAGRSRARSTGSRPQHAVDAEVRIYDHLFARPIRTTSRKESTCSRRSTRSRSRSWTTAKVEPSLAAPRAGRPRPVRAHRLLRRRRRRTTLRPTMASAVRSSTASPPSATPGPRCRRTSRSSGA